MKKATWSLIITILAFLSLASTVTSDVKAQMRARPSPTSQQAITRQSARPSEETRCIIGRDAVLNDPSLSREQIKTYLDYIDKERGFVFDRDGMLDVLNGSGGNAAACRSDCDWCCCDANGSNCRCC